MTSQGAALKRRKRLHYYSLLGGFVTALVCCNCSQNNCGLLQIDWMSCGCRDTKTTTRLLHTSMIFSSLKEKSLTVLTLCVKASVELVKGWMKLNCGRLTLISMFIKAWATLWAKVWLMHYILLCKSSLHVVFWFCWCFEQ